jgi:hypothetical protein
MEVGNYVGWYKGPLHVTLNGVSSDLYAKTYQEDLSLALLY